MRKPVSNQNGSQHGQEITNLCIEDAKENVIPYDENLLECARIQWQFGDWKSLAQLTWVRLQHHPDRAKLALLAAAGKLQNGENLEARQFIRLAQDWGVSKRLMGQILISGVYNSLGRAAAILGKRQLSLKYFESSIAIGSPNSPIKLIASARENQEIIGLGFDLGVSDPTHNTVIKTAGKLPRIIILNGMVRSGSTVSMNIVTGLLEGNGIAYMKYYIADFDNLNQLRDHIHQNKNLICVLKTHSVNSELENIANEFSAAYIYTKRDLVEVAASFVRMSKIKESPFYRSSPITFEDIVLLLNDQKDKYEKTKYLNNLLSLDCEEFSDENMQAVVEKIAMHIGLKGDEYNIEKISKLFSRSASSELTNSIHISRLTSLGHEESTFFHKSHVMADGTNIHNELSMDWIQKIRQLFKL